MLDQIQFDSDKIQNGTWVNLHNSKLLIAHSSKPEFRNALVSKACDGHQITDIEICNEIATYILLDWYDIKTPWGGDLEYSKDLAAYALSTNAELRDFVDHVSVDYSYFK